MSCDFFSPSWKAVQLEGNFQGQRPVSCRRRPIHGWRNTMRNFIGMLCFVFACSPALAADAKKGADRSSKGSAGADEVLRHPGWRQEGR